MFMRRTYRSAFKFQMRGVLATALTATLFLTVACSSKPTTPTADAGAGTNSDANANNSPGNSNHNVAGGEAQPLIIPAHTNISVRLAQTLSTKTAAAGENFSATVAKPIVIEGKTAIDRKSVV